jgi:hypothetical protein
MLTALLWLALQTPIQVSDIAEMGCQGNRCLSLADVAKLPPEQLPAGCQLQMLAISGYAVPSEPVLICETPSQPAAANAARRPGSRTSNSSSARSSRASRRPQ